MAKGHSYHAPGLAHHGLIALQYGSALIRPGGKLHLYAVDCPRPLRRFPTAVFAKSAAASAQPCMRRDNDQVN